MNQTARSLLVWTISWLSVASWAGDQPIVSSDLLRVRTIQDIDVAADGSKAVFVVRSIAAKNENDRDDHASVSYEYQSHLFIIDLQDRRSIATQLTFGRRADHSPQLSPDGGTIAFVRSRTNQSGGAERESQVWLLPLSGGEARPLTAFEHGANSPQWSPDGSRLLVSSAVPLSEIEGVPPWPSEQPQRGWPINRDEGSSPRPDGTREQIRAWLDANAEAADPSVINRIDFQAEQGLEKEYTFQHLFLISLSASVAAKQADAVQLTEGFQSHVQARFTSDGARVVYAVKKEASVHPDRVRENELRIVNADGADDRQLLSLDGWTLGDPQPSLDGSVVAFTASQVDEPSFRQTQIGMAPIAEPGDEPLWLTDMIDRSVIDFRWMSARGSILFNVADRGGFPLYSISPARIEPAQIVGRDVGVNVFDVGGGAVVWGESSVGNPNVLQVSTPKDGTWIAYDANEWVHEKRLSQPEETWIDRPDGTRVQMWIMPPTNLQEGETYPVVLEMHGGPAAMWGPGEASMWHEFQLLCSWGFGVVYCNQRGSGGYGYEFQKANFQNWGEGPAGDALAAIDRALQRDWVDADRLVITGGSYAGYLTAWIVGHDHRFKAAVAQRGVYELTTFFGEGNAWRLVEWAMGGYPWESSIRPVLLRESPFTYVRRIQTPLMIMHASNDLRTGVSQSEMLYRALKVLEQPVEYVRYPNAGHDLSRTGNPSQRMDRLNRMIDFFERYVRNDRAAPVIE